MSTTDFTLAVMIGFLLFWAQGGWYRIDCAVNVPAACSLIAQEYTKNPKP